MPPRRSASALGAAAAARAVDDHPPAATAAPECPARASRQARRRPPAPARLPLSRRSSSRRAKPGENLPSCTRSTAAGSWDGPDEQRGQLVRSGKVVYVFAARLGISASWRTRRWVALRRLRLQDQQAGLRWVQRSIASFGGDPATSPSSAIAGGASTCDQVASPTAKGLFQRRSASAGSTTTSDNIVWSKADCKIDLLHRGSSPEGRRAGRGEDRLRRRRRRRRLPAQRPGRDAGRRRRSVHRADSRRHDRAIVNGTTLTMSPAKAFATGHVNQVELISDVGRTSSTAASTQIPRTAMVVADKTPSTSSSCRSSRPAGARGGTAVTAEPVP